MKIIIVGGGKVGFYLAQTLSAQGHDAAIIEQDRELCRMIANQLDISICTGDGTSQDVLREAGAERADVVCAVTGKDESNLVCCQTAKKVFDVKKTVAKVNNPNNVAALRTLGVDTVVSSTSPADRPQKVMRGLCAFAELSGQFIQFSPCYQGLRGAANQCEAILAPDNILIIRRVDQLAVIKQALQPAVPLCEY